MNKTEAIKLLVNEGWTQADAKRALDVLDFSGELDELSICRVAAKFAGAELEKRQRLQAAQKGMVTKKNKEIELNSQRISDLEVGMERLVSENQVLNNVNIELSKANESLQKDNKALRNLVDQIKLQLAIEVKGLLKYENSEIRQALAKWLKGMQG